MFKEKKVISPAKLVENWTSYKWVLLFEIESNKFTTMLDLVDR